MTSTSHLRPAPAGTHVRARTGIIVFGFRRPRLLEHVLESLRRQDALANTHVWLDGTQGLQVWGDEPEACKTVAAGHAVASIVAHRGHCGIEKLLIDGLSWMCQNYERIIVLEDDCFPSSSAVAEFERELDLVADDESMFSVYGHHFLVPAEAETITRFQGWGWATTRDCLRPVLEEVKARFAMSEPDYLVWTEQQLTPEICALLDVTMHRDVTKVLRGFFSWDSCTALVCAVRGLSHRPTAKRVVFNCGMGADSGHFVERDWLRKPPFNMVHPDEVWDYF